MAEEQEVQAVAGAEEEEEKDLGYKTPAFKSLDEIMKQDTEDESLKKYKEQLLGGGSANAIVGE